MVATYRCGSQEIWWVVGIFMWINGTIAWYNMGVFYAIQTDNPGKFLDDLTVLPTPEIIVRIRGIIPK